MKNIFMNYQQRCKILLGTTGFRTKEGIVLISVTCQPLLGQLNICLDMNLGQYWEFLKSRSDLHSLKFEHSFARQDKKLRKTTTD